MPHVVIVQQILTHWSKVSRGGAGAARRNAVPSVISVPLHTTNRTTLTLMHHKLRFSEHNNFAQPSKESIENPPIGPICIGCVEISLTDDAVIATFAYNQRCGGAPDRSWIQKALTLSSSNEWGQIVYNGRFNDGWDGPWYYEKMVVNVGLFDAPSNNVFTDSKPDQRFASIAHLS